MALEDASTTKKGIVQLSSATNSTSETLAATPKAVKAANDNANGRVPSNRKVNGKALTADITLTPKDIGTLNSVTISFSGGAGWFKLATVTMPQASSIVYIALIGGAGYNVGSPHQAGISELVLRAGNGNPKGITGALWKRTAVGLTNFAWINTSGDTYDIYVEIGNYATSVNIHWDCTANATVSIYTSPTYSASKPSSVTDGVVYTMYSTHQKPTPLDIGALPTTGGTVSGPLSVTGGITGTLNGNASTATKLQTARSIGGVGFDGSANINLPGVNTTGNQNTTGNAATATKLQTARTIGGVSFDGTANINLPGVNTAGNQSTTGNAATATKLQTARTINGVKFDGSADITLTPANLDVYSKSEIDNKKGMRKYTFSAPANAVSGKWYPIVFRRSRGSTDELASRVVITTGSSVGGYAMNNCEFNGFVMPGGWSDRGSYAAGFFSIYSTAERAIHSIISSVKDDDLCSVFYVEARAFPIKIFAEEGLNVIVPTADYAVGQTTYKWGATDPLSESTNAQIILDFKNGRGYYCSHPFISSLSGNAATATKLQTARTIGGVVFDGSANINLPGVNTTGNQNTTGNAATATKLQTVRKISGVPFDGSTDITLTAAHVAAFARRATGSYADADGGVPWNAESGAYNVTRTGDSYILANFYTGVGSCRTLQIKANYKNGGLFYRSSRDGYGFESGWEQVYTTGFMPQPADINAPTAAAGWLNSGNGTAFTTAQFITWLNNQGAFTNKHWIARCSWSYANNNYIDDTGCGRIDLSGSVIEVFSNKATSHYTIRVTTTTTSGHGGVNNAEFIYVYNGSDYAPGWRRSYNTRNKPTASDVGALPLSGGTLSGGLTSSGEIVSKYANGFRIAYGSFGFFIRNDGSNTYFMLTASGDTLGSWNALRPMYINNVSGAVTMGNGLTLAGGLNVTSGNIRIPTSSTSWIDMRNNAALSNSSAVATSSASAIIRQEHADRHYFVGGLGNSQFGFYMINKSRTANGTDANAYLQNDGTWVCGGNGSFNDVYIRSDRRSKRNIRKIERALDKLEQIEGVLYEIQVCGRYEQSGGLIAQDVQNVQPELVTVDHNDQSGEPRLRLNYNGVIGMLVEAVKELREEVRELKTKM
nr:tail fiber protein [Escherichia coli]